MSQRPVSLRILAIGFWGLQGPVAAQTPERWTVRPGPEITIGAATGDDHYLHQDIQSALVLRDGAIAVADGGRREVRIYEADGTFRVEMGGNGEGPGEFSNIAGMWLTPDGDIGIWDPGLRRFTTFGPDGEIRSTANVTPAGRLRGSLEVFWGTLENGDVLLAAMSFSSEVSRTEARPDPWSMGRFSPDGRQVAEVLDVRGMWRMIRIPIPFSPMPHVAVSGGSIYLADGFAPEVLKFAPSGEELAVLQVPETDAAADEAWDWLEKEMARRKETLYLEYLAGGRISRDSPLPSIGGFLPGASGGVWVKAYDPTKDAIWVKRNAMVPASGGVWYVLDSDGRHVATVSLPDEFRPLQVSNGRLLGMTVDELGVQRVVVYRLDTSID